MRHYYIYILSNKNNTTLYIGITNNILRRVSEHETNIGGFANRYKCFKLVYYEQFNNPTQAIAREKQLKRWSRVKKDNLIKTLNPELNDLIMDF